MKLENIFKALGEENRLKIVDVLKKGEKCACELLSELNITQPTLSHHMKILENSNLINSRRVGKWTHYSLNLETIKLLKDFMVIDNG